MNRFAFARKINFGLQLFEVGRILGWPHESVAADPTR